MRKWILEIWKIGCDLDRFYIQLISLPLTEFGTLTEVKNHGTNTDIKFILCKKKQTFQF